jgi:hypothetical protein
VVATELVAGPCKWFAPTRPAAVAIRAAHLPVLCAGRLQVIWAPLLGALSTLFDEYHDPRLVTLCLQGFAAGACLTAQVRLQGEHRAGKARGACSAGYASSLAVELSVAEHPLLLDWHVQPRCGGVYLGRCIGA